MYNRSGGRGRTDARGLHKRYLFMSRRVPAAKPQTASRINNATGALIGLPLESLISFILFGSLPSHILLILTSPCRQSYSIAPIPPFHQRPASQLPESFSINIRLNRIASTFLPLLPNNSRGLISLTSAPWRGIYPLHAHFFLGTVGTWKEYPLSRIGLVLFCALEGRRVSAVVIVPRLLRMSVWSS